MSRLFEPLKVGSLSIRNRIMMPALLLDMPNKDGEVTDEDVAFYRRRARGGVGVICVGACYVNTEARQGPNQIGIDNDSHLEGLRRISSAILEEGAACFAQLNHAGRYAPSRYIGCQPVAPSALASRYTGEMPRELDFREIEKIQDDFGKAARRARDAGFSGIEILAASGYLISEFLSAATNRRTDRYGGDLLARMRFLLELVARVKEEVGDDYPLCCRISFADRVAGGNTFEDTKTVAEALVEAGVHILSVTAGWHDSTERQITADVPQGSYVRYAQSLKEVLSVPVVAAVRITSPAMASEIIGKGEADMIAMGRALISDPDWPNKARAGNASKIRRCIACCHCFDRAFGHLPIECSVNPEMGRDMTFPEPCNTLRKVLVIGGGPAGMQTAITAAARGHRVTIVEKGREMGGRLLSACIPPFKEEIIFLRDYLVSQIVERGIDVILEGEDLESVAETVRPDVAVLAAGAEPIILEMWRPLLGLKAFTAEEVLSGRVLDAKEVVVIGGGLVGCETADFLSQRGYGVTIVEIAHRIGSDVGISNRWGLLDRLKEKKVNVLVDANVRGIGEEALEVEVSGQKETLDVKFEAAILAVGYAPDPHLEKRVRRIFPDVHVIGNSRKAGRIIDAVREGYNTGCLL